MIAAVLFDLDGTLLDMDLDRFFGAYFGLIGPVLARLLGTDDPRPGLSAVLRGTEAMSSHHPQETNREVFNRTFRELTGLDLDDCETAEHLATFYRESFPSLGSGHGPRPGAQDAVAAARSAGLKTVLATNPIFPLAAIEERARWAGLDPAEFDWVTSYETSRATKPSATYYLEVAERIDVHPRDCLMVGDDRTLDLPAALTGMRTFYVGADPGDGDGEWGTLDSLAEHLSGLTR